MAQSDGMDSVAAFGTAQADGFLSIDIAGDEGVQRARHLGEEWFALCMRQRLPFVVVLREPPLAAVRMDLRSVPGVVLTAELQAEVRQQIQRYGREESQVQLEAHAVSVLPVDLAPADFLADGLAKIGQQAMAQCGEVGP